MNSLEKVERNRDQNRVKSSPCLKEDYSPEEVNAMLAVPGKVKMLPELDAIWSKLSLAEARSVIDYAILTHARNLITMRNNNRKAGESNE